MLMTVANPVAGAGFMGMQIQAGEEEALKAQGVAPERAEMAGFGSASMQSVLETVGIGKVMQAIKPVKGLVGKGLNAAKASMSEFMTEWFQKYPALMAQIWAETPGKTIDQRYENFADGFWEATKEGWYEGSIGAVLGGGPAVVSQVGNTIKERIQRPKPEATIKEVTSEAEPEVLTTPEERQTIIKKTMGEDVVQTDRRQAPPVDLGEIERREGERRVDEIRRKKIDELTPEEKDIEIADLRKAIDTDNLSGLMNKNAHDRKLKESKEDVPYLLIDLDGFKWVNDMTKAGELPSGEAVKGSYPLGDEILRVQGEIMSETLDELGLTEKANASRHGGDEFGIFGDDLTIEELDAAHAKVKEKAQKVIIDILGQDDIHYRLNGLPFSSGLGRGYDHAITETKASKKQRTESGERIAGRGAKPGTITEVDSEASGGDQADIGGKENLAPTDQGITQKIEPTKTQAEVDKIEIKKPTGLMYKTKVQIEETGEIVEIEQDVNDALKDTDERLHNLRVLKDCI
jgi:GGDEF domain-containing protein